uniref:Chitin-binding type-2 domain-containing protein n=1 Tax=Graphocephala atropunctata TaxID=36148 RepID=A0A1B6L9X9_9HEMI
MLPRILLFIWNMIMTVNTVSETYTCPYEDGIFYATNDVCNFYYRCENQTLRSGMCHSWQKFDVHTLTCRKLKEVDCNPDYAGVWRAVYAEVPETSEGAQVHETLREEGNVQGINRTVNKTRTLNAEERKVNTLDPDLKESYKTMRGRGTIMFNRVLNMLLHVKMRSYHKILSSSNRQSITFEEDNEQTFLSKRQVVDSLQENSSEDMTIALPEDEVPHDLLNKISEIPKETDDISDKDLSKPVNNERTIIKAEMKLKTDTRQQTSSPGYWYWCGSGRYVFVSDIQQGSSICLTLQDPESTDREDTTQQGEGTGHTYLGTITSYH